MKFENTEVFNIEGAMRGMRFPKKGVGDTAGSLIGEKDMDLAQRLWRASENDNLAHSKFLRQIMVSVDISAPIYWWTEMDTYKIGTTANSESTMHKLTEDAKNLSIKDFWTTDAYSHHFILELIPKLQEIAESKMPIQQRRVILKQMLPASYIQKRHWTANYEVVRNICKQRKGHRLLEWSGNFIEWAKTLPYSVELIFGGVE